MKKLAVAVASIGFFITTATINVSAEEYEVQQQDSLWGIAQKYDTSVQNLVDINDLDSIIIHPGQKITTDVDKEDTATSTESHTVKKGDSLSKIASKYNVTVNELIDWNDLSDDLIIIGQELEVNDASQKENDTKEEEVDSSKDAEGETISVTATAYTAKCDGCSGVTSTGIDLNANPDKKVIAVDPNVIPLGTEVYVEGYGNAIAGDTGGAIKGNKIDVHVPTKDAAKSWGKKTVDVTILD